MLASCSAGSAGWSAIVGEAYVDEGFGWGGLGRLEFRVWGVGTQVLRLASPSKPPETLNHPKP